MNLLIHPSSFRLHPFRPGGCLSKLAGLGLHLKVQIRKELNSLKFALTIGPRLLIVRKSKRVLGAMLSRPVCIDGVGKTVVSRESMAASMLSRPYPYKDQ